MNPGRPAYTHNGYPKLLDPENYPGNKPPWGTLNCIDHNTSQLRWKVSLGEYPELTAQGIPRTGTGLATAAAGPDVVGKLKKSSNDAGSTVELIT